MNRLRGRRIHQCKDLARIDASRCRRWASGAKDSGGLRLLLGRLEDALSQPGPLPPCARQQEIRDRRFIHERPPYASDLPLLRRAKCPDCDRRRDRAHAASCAATRAAAQRKTHLLASKRRNKSGSAMAPGRNGTTATSNSAVLQICTGSGATKAGHRRLLRAIRTETAAWSLGASRRSSSPTA